MLLNSPGSFLMLCILTYSLQIRKILNLKKEVTGVSSFFFISSVCGKVLILEKNLFFFSSEILADLFILSFEYCNMK